MLINNLSRHSTGAQVRSDCTRITRPGPEPRRPDAVQEPHQAIILRPPHKRAPNAVKQRLFVTQSITPPGSPTPLRHQHPTHVRFELFHEHPHQMHVPAPHRLTDCASPAVRQNADFGPSREQKRDDLHVPNPALAHHRVLQRPECDGGSGSFHRGA
ncbi:hypothetical protein M427DRAFT_54722 [Gonapodya prolifera JEL478]|uniref:Uncharacterized protein n=1 Tax=Gonapodya prolifera (strain JEL478) TaxID=1344416 RepID=A0A139ALS4_GONPJ|nr:hypothetical protein M427DRAFT_54722 [Gonapodya prolifera JEL478]|eukprot:KXS17453.1 hypothetical protein M427DRAFT_54722 [Gonapodya prolifera JEL478]